MCRRQRFLTAGGIPACPAWAGAAFPTGHRHRRPTMTPPASRRVSPTAMPTLDTDQLFPHEANLDQLGGVSFDKGCYIGQEVVSRMEHRGTARSRILPLTLSGPAPVSGTEIRAGDKLVGTMLSSAGTRALGLIRLDRLAEAAAAPADRCCHGPGAETRLGSAMRCPGRRRVHDGRKTRGWHLPLRLVRHGSALRRLSRHGMGRARIRLAALFEKLLLDGFQAGLSWITILRKRDNFRAAFDGFDPAKMARYTREEAGPSDAGQRHRAQPAEDRGQRQQCPGLSRDPGFLRLSLGFPRWPGRSRITAAA